MAGRHCLGIVQFGTFDFLKQHRRNDGLIVFRPERETCDKVGLRREKMNGRTLSGARIADHDKFLFELMMAGPGALLRLSVREQRPPLRERPRSATS